MEIDCDWEGIRRRKIIYSESRRSTNVIWNLIITQEMKGSEE